MSELLILQIKSCKLSNLLCQESMLNQELNASLKKQSPFHLPESPTQCLGTLALLPSLVSCAIGPLRLAHAKSRRKVVMALFFTHWLEYLESFLRMEKSKGQLFCTRKNRAHFSCLLNVYFDCGFP